MDRKDTLIWWNRFEYGKNIELGNKARAAGII